MAPDSPSGATRTSFPGERHTAARTRSLNTKVCVDHSGKMAR
jgi:hypothetical protein